MVSARRRNVIAGVALGIAVSGVAGFINGVLVMQAGGSNDIGHAYVLGAGKNVSVLHVVAWLILGLLAGSALRGLYGRWTRGWRPWTTSLPIAAIALAAIIGVQGTALADDGGWQECAGAGVGCLFPAFDSSPSVSVVMFLGFAAGWIWPTLPARGWTFASDAVRDRSPLRKQESPEDVDSAAVTASGVLGQARVAVEEDVDSSATHSVRFVAGLGPRGVTLKEDRQ